MSAAVRLSASAGGGDIVLIEVFCLLGRRAEELPAIGLDKPIAAIVLENQVQHHLPSLVHVRQLDGVQLFPRPRHGSAQGPDLISMMEGFSTTLWRAIQTPRSSMFVAGDRGRWWMQITL